MSRHRILLFASVLFAAALLGAPEVRAQVGLSPAFVSVTVERGAARTQEFTITNNTRARLRFRCSLSDYWIDENKGRMMGRPGTLPRSASLWVQFAPPEVIVEPNSTATIKTIITVPQTASGGYYTVPFFEGEPVQEPSAAAQQKDTSGAGFVIRLGGFLMLVTKDSTYDVEIVEGQVRPPTPSSEFEMQFDIRNRGNAHARLRGQFVILDAAGKIAGRGRIDEKWYLPSQRERLTASWAGELPPGRYTVVSTLSYDRAGREPATLVYELPFETK